MPRIDQLIVVVPGVLSDCRAELARHGTIPDRPALSALLRVAECTQQWPPEDIHYARLDPWQTAFLFALGGDCYTHGLASAALSWQGEGHPERGDSFLHLEPVHLAAGVDRLYLSHPPVRREERERLADDMRAVLADAGMELRWGLQGDWYAWSPKALDLVTYSPRTRFDHHVYEMMPSGTDGAQLRRVMTEIQMLWYTHPLNVERERRGEPAINGVWLWGSGQPHTMTLADSPQVLSSRPYVLGLCESWRIPCMSLPDVDGLLSRSAAKIIAVLDERAPQTLEPPWLSALSAAVQRGVIGELDLRLDHWRIVVRGGAWHKMKNLFKKTNRSLGELLA